MKIKLDDKVKINSWDSGVVVVGTVEAINISLDYYDKKAEMGSAVQVKEYDTELDYIGTISYQNEYKEPRWAYFNQIVGVV
jgi:hypothetical protein